MSTENNEEKNAITEEIVETEFGTYHFMYSDEGDLETIKGPEGIYNFYYTEEFEIDKIDAPNDSYEFFFTQSGKLDSIKGNTGELVFYYNGTEIACVEANGEIDDKLVEKLTLFGLIGEAEAEEE